MDRIILSRAILACAFFFSAWAPCCWAAISAIPTPAPSLNGELEKTSTPSLDGFDRPFQEVGLPASASAITAMALLQWRIIPRHLGQVPLSGLRRPSKSQPPFHDGDRANVGRALLFDQRTLLTI